MKLLMKRILNIVCERNMDGAIIKVLEQASSQDPNLFKPAEETLRQWETHRGFYTALFNIFSNHLISINVRWMAILYFKNGVDRYWRKHALSEINVGEKEFLRQGLISTFDEPVNQLAIQLAILIAKIARYDCPKEWSALVPTLIEAIKSNNSLTQHRALLTFHHVIKALASKRLIADKRIFQELTVNVFNFIFDLWNTFTESFIMLHSDGGSTDQIQESIEKALLSLRILRKLIIIGIDKPSENPNVMFFLKIIFERIRTILDCRKNLVSRGTQMEICDKFLIHLTKILLGVLELHPFCYIELIPTTFECTVFYSFTEPGQLLSFERFTIQCLNLLKKVLQTNDYKPDKIIEDSKYSLTLKAHQFKQEFFTPEILTVICTRLVTHYFVLTASDLDLWNADPENFGIDDCGESWKYSLRPCTESVFLVILHQFKDTLSSVLVDLIQKHHHIIDPHNLQGILIKDAVYNAVGLAGFDLYDEVNFDQWFSTTLKQEFKERSDNYKIIRRRVCWLIGKWTGIKLSIEYRPELYDLLVQALHIDEDLSVRLAASDALKLAIDDFQFNTEDFIPFLEPSFALLFSLLKDVSACDTKMRVLYILSFMIERIGNGIKPHIGALNAYLPELWQQSENHHMLRCAIVSTLVHLQKALGSDSINLQPLVISVIEASCDVHQESHVYLLEDGLELWLAFLENTSLLNEGIMNISENLPALLESSADNLRLCLYIIQAYVLLKPEEFLLKRGAVIINSLRSIISDLRSEGVAMVMRLLELCLKAAPQLGAEFLKPLLLKIFENIFKGEEYPLVLTMYLAIVARILLTSRVIFVQVIKELMKELGEGLQEDAIFAQITRTFLNHMPLVTQQKKRKLLALALCSLIDVDCLSIIFQYFPQIISNIVETLNDITKISDKGCSIDSLVIDHNSSQLEEVICETEHSQRKRRLILNDPVHCIVLEDLLQNQLFSLRASIGNEQFSQLMQNISFDVDQQLRGYINI